MEIVAKINGCCLSVAHQQYCQINRLFTSLLPLQSTIPPTRVSLTLTTMDTMNNNDNAEANKETASSSPRTIVLPPPPRAAELLSVPDDQKKRLYWDRSHYASPEDQMRALAKSSSLYIGNLAFTTRSRHIRAHFSQLGPVKTIQMGLDRLKKTPCGFCFVEYLERKDALAAVSCLSGTKLDGRVIRVELDAGFQPGRQYGRGVSGGQVRDDRRGASDPTRKRARPNESSPAPQQQQQPSGEQTAATSNDTNDAAAASGGDGGGDGHYAPAGDSMEQEVKRQRT